MRVSLIARVALALAASACLAFAVHAPAATPRAQLKMAAGTLSMSNSKSGSAILSASEMSPGDVATGTVTIGNTGTAAGDFSLSSFDVTDVPGRGGGLLSTALAVTILDVTDPAAVRSVYTGSLGAMTPRTLGTFAPGSEHTYSFSVGLATGSRVDSVQGGAVTVGYRWSAVEAPDGPAPPPTTSTTPTTAPPPTPPPTDTTPTTTPPGLAPFKLTHTGPRRGSARKRRGPAVTAGCSRVCSMRAAVKVRGARRKVALKVRSKSMARAAGRATRFEVLLPKRSVRTIRRALARHRRLTITVKVKATDAYKLLATGRRVIRVKR